MVSLFDDGDVRLNYIIFIDKRMMNLTMMIVGIMIAMVIVLSMILIFILQLIVIIYKYNDYHYNE